MKKTKILAAAVAVATLVLFSGCEFLSSLFSVLAAPQGYVVDGRTGEALSGVTVELKNVDTGAVTFTATTSETGYYTFTEVEYGVFELTGTLSGYTFIKQLVEVSGLAQSFPNIAGLATDIDGDGTDDLVSGVLTIVTFWDTAYDDVDVHFTTPVGNVGTVEFAANGSDFYNPSEDNSLAGFFPDTTTSRTRIYYGEKVYPSGYTTVAEKLANADVWLDVDNTGASTQQAGGPETITVYYAPITTAFNSSDVYVSSGSGDPSKLDAGSWTPIGVMEFYLDAYGADMELASSDNSGAATPKVYVFDGANQIALYTLPQYTDIERASIFKINTFVDTNDTVVYQILPDLRLLDDATSANLRSAGATLEPVVVEARTRR